MNKVRFINSYSFIFSARPGTPAFRLKKINENTAKKGFQFSSYCRKN